MEVEMHLLIAKKANQLLYKYQVQEFPITQINSLTHGLDCKDRG